MLIHSHCTRALRRLLGTFLFLAAFCATGTAHAVNFFGAYSETFNSIGETGTTPPDGWSVKVGNSGSTNTAWTATITGTGTNSVASMVATANSLAAIAAPGSNNNNGFNAQGSSSSDRVLATSPTSISGSALELAITNTTGAAITALQVGYDIRRYTAPATANELPGYWLFYSHDNGATWTNVSTLNPVSSGTNGVVVPNSVGITTVPGTTFILSDPWEVNQVLLLRWVDDNAAQSSPDQIIGLDNVSMAAPNQPPVVTLQAPLNNATVIGPSASLEVGIADPEGDAVNVGFYGRTKASATPGPDFSLIVLPDTQYYSQNSGGNRAAIFQSQTQWIVNNRTERNIAFVSHMGDITQNGDNSGNPSEWINADTAMALIESPATTQLPDGMPWGVMPGNHDLLPGDQTATGSFYNQYFGVSRFAGRSYYGGHYGTTNNNNYQLFSASGLDFIVVNLAYRNSPDQAILDWADTLLKAYPSRRAIVSTHWILNTGDPASFGGAGQAIYDRLKSNPNFFLMLCGHMHGEGKRSDTYEGRTVHTILSDYQGATNGGNGFLRILTFSPTSNTIHVESYSPTLGRAVNSSDGVVSWTGPYDLPGTMQEMMGNWALLGTVDVPAGDTTATFSWSGLQSGTPYEWYASATDGNYTATSSTGTFATSPEIITLTLSTLTLSPTSITGGASSQGTVTLSAAAPIGGAVVTLSDNSSAAIVPTSVTVPAGSTSATFTISSSAVSSSTTVTISAAAGGVEKTATLTVAPPSLSSLSLNPTTVAGGSTSQGTVTLSAAAPAGGAVVTIRDNSSATTVPASITVPAGSTSTIFTITTSIVTSSRYVTISATYRGVTRTATLTVTRSTAPVLSTLSLNPATVAGGSTSQGTVTLSAAAATGGAVVALNDNSSAATLPASVTVPAGSTSAIFTIATISVASSTPVTISAVYGGVTKTAPLTISSVNQPPVATNDTYSTNQNTSMTMAAPGVLVNDIDPEGTSLTAQLVSGPSHGTLTLNTNGSFTYTPTMNYAGSDSFIYRASDGTLTSGSAAVTLTVTPIGNVLFSDDFARSTNPPPLSPWTPATGAWTVNSGILQGTGPLSAYNHVYYAPAPLWDNYIVEGQIKLPSSAFGGGLGCRVNPATGAQYIAVIFPDNSVVGPNVVQLVKMWSWTTYSGTEMAQASIPSIGTGWHNLKLVCNGNRIQVFYDGTSVINVTDNNYDSRPPYLTGGIGVSMATSDSVYAMSIDNVVVSALTQ